MSTLDFTPALARSYEAKLEHAASRAAWHATKAEELQTAFIAAAFGNDPSALVPTPGKSVKQRPIGWLLIEYIDEGQLFHLIRDAAVKGNVEASLLLSVMSLKFAREHADFALEEAEAEGDDSDSAQDARRDREFS